MISSRSRAQTKAKIAVRAKHCRELGVPRAHRNAPLRHDAAGRCRGLGVTRLNSLESLFHKEGLTEFGGQGAETGHVTTQRPLPDGGLNSAKRIL